MLISEGNYPYHWGGVSTWCHILINELKENDFIQYSLIDDADRPLKFTLPDNVVEFRGQPLWGMHRVMETRKQLSVRDLLLTVKRTTPEVIETCFLPPFRAFIVNLFTGEETAAGAARLLHRLHRFFLAYDYDTAMCSRAAWRCFMETVQQYGPQAMEARGYAGETISLAEATKALQWLYHWLIPLAEPIPKVDVAHAAMAGISAMVAVMAKLEHGAAFLLTEHGVYLRERYFFEAEKNSSLFLKCFSLFFALCMTEISYGMADKIAPCCNFNKRWEIRRGADPSRLKTIYYGVDSSKFSPSGRPPNDPLVVVWMGRIDPLKDLFTLLQAAALVHKERPEIQFRLFGSAPQGNEAYNEQCLALRRELGLEDTVIFAGFRSDTNNAYNEGDIFVLTSKSEAFPFVNLEAMLCERPVVSSAVGGVPEQLEGCGFAVEPRNPHALADAILQLAADPALRATFGRDGRCKVITEYSIERFACLHAETYQEVLRLAEPTPERRAAESESANWYQPAFSNDFDPIRENSQNGKTAAGVLPSTHPSGFLIQPANSARQAASGEDDRCSGYRETRYHKWVRSMGMVRLHDAAYTRIGTPAADEEWTKDRHELAVTRSFGIVRSQALVVEREKPLQAPVSNPEGISILAGEVIERDPRPIDELEVTALLEAQGITDPVVRQRYGFPSTFELGEAVLSQVRKSAGPQKVVKITEAPEESLSEKLFDFARGPLSLVPIILVMLIISAISIFSGWKYSMVLALSVGMTGSMIINSGLLQSVGRRISIYRGMHNEKMARLFFVRATYFFIGADFLAAVLATAALLLSGIFNSQQGVVFCIAFVGMAWLWLLGGELAVIGKVWWLARSLVTGILVGAVTSQLVILVSRAAPFFSGQYLAWGCGVGYLAALSMLIYAMSQALTGPQSEPPAGSKLRLPPLVFLASEAAPYFFYGSLYMIFILVPHLLGLTGRLPAGVERMTASTQFELVFTLAMFPMAIASGINEQTLRSFWKLLPKATAGSPMSPVSEFQQKLHRFSDGNRKKYRTWLVIVSLEVDSICILALQIPAVLSWLHLGDPWQVVILFQVALVTFGLIGLGIYNAMYCLTLGSAQSALRPVVSSLAVTLFIGIPASAFDYRYSAAAFFIGAVVLVFSSRRKLRATLDESAYLFAFSI